MKKPRPKASIAPHPTKKNKSIIKIVNNIYEVDRYFGDGIDAVVGSITREDGELVCCRARDFGGCGKDAMKPERNVPVGAWLAEIRAVEVTNG